MALSSCSIDTGKLKLQMNYMKATRSSCSLVGIYNKGISMSYKYKYLINRKGSFSFTVKSLKKDEMQSSSYISQISTGKKQQQEEEEEVVVIDGLQPAILTPPKDLKRSDFPLNFLFGASTSALQTEGTGTEGGRGSSTWDFMLQGRNAVNSYLLYKEDVKLLKAMGMTSYRFSIAWPRILPKGTEEFSSINQEGIDFYNNLINELIANGITPVVTLFHFDLPVTLQEKYHGFMNPQIIEDFKKYADICFKNFGDRVKFWSTINEPFVFGSFGYKMGLPDDVANDPLGPYIATHNIILAHAAAADLYHHKYQKKQKGKMGISLPCKWFEPQSLDPKDVDAAKKHLDFMLGWYMDPFVNGDYPRSMKEAIKGLPEFTKEQKKMVKEACDYIGLNYYTARYSKQHCVVDSIQGVITVQYLESKVDLNGNPIGEQAQGQDEIYVHPEGLKNLLVYIKEKYKDPEIYITENGVPAVPTITGSVQDSIKEGKIPELEGAFLDDYRITHAETHLTAIREAMKEGANVKGYFVWSLMDNMEVGAGYDVRFGLNFTDYYDNCKRYRKKSAFWFANFLQDAPADKNKGKHH